MPAFRAPMFVSPSVGTSSVTINVGFRRPFIAFVTVTMIDSLIDFDFDNAVAADVFRVDGVTTPGLRLRSQVGDHREASTMWPRERLSGPAHGSRAFSGIAALTSLRWRRRSSSPSPSTKGRL